MTEEEAVALMVEGGFQEEAEARAKYDRARLSSTQLSTYFAGSMEMWDIELEARRRAAAAEGADPTRSSRAASRRLRRDAGFRYRPHLEAVIATARRRPALLGGSCSAEWPSAGGARRARGSFRRRRRARACVAAGSLSALRSRSTR